MKIINLSLFLFFFVYGLNAQTVLFPIENIDSIEIESIYPNTFTVVDIDMISYEKKITESYKRSIVIRDTAIIRNIADSINSITPDEYMCNIDIRGKLVFFLANEKKAVFYIGVNTIQYHEKLYKFSNYIFKLLFLPFEQ